MGTFLLILLFVLLYIFIAPIVRVWRKVRQFQDQYTRTMSGSNTGTTAGNSDDYNNKEDMAQKYRRYSSENGEYVDFEELEGTITESPSTHDADTPRSRYQEEAVSDAEFEEI